MTRKRAEQIIPALDHRSCLHLGVSGLNFEADVLPAHTELHFVLHAWIGTGVVQSPRAEHLRYNLPEGQAYALLQRGVFARPYQVPGFEDSVGLHLFGIVSGVNPGHSLCDAQAWFPESEQLIRRVLNEHVHGRPAIAFGACWRLNLAELHKQIFAAIVQGGLTIQDIPPSYYVVREAVGLTDALAS